MHVSIMTKNGESVALTSTVNLAFGSQVMDAATGILLNDQLDDFSIPNVSNAFGLPPSPYNYIYPGKRPLSSCTPTIVVVDKQVVAVVGASGGSQIITATSQTIVRMLDMQADPHVAVHAGRTHSQLVPDVVLVEENGPVGVALEKKGHVVVEGHIYTGVAAVQRTRNGILQGAGDQRKDGFAVAY